MESLSRPPHRRKHSTATNAFSSSSFSLKNPYDDIVFSKGGGKAKFGVHEYAEIFSGSSSIPVLDLSGLDERVGSVDGRSSKLDYWNIFGGLRDDDVGVPYDELFNGAAAKKTNTRIPEDAKSPSQDSGSLHSPGKTKRPSGEAPDQSTDGVKQHFNMSFNKTNQRNIDTSNGKTHIAQLHAVPGFTYFVDATPRSQKTEVGGPVSSLKREVSRTWSFSAGVEAVKVAAGSSLEKSHQLDKSHNVNEINLKSHISKVPPPSSHLSNVTDNKDSGRSKLPTFASKDASEKTAGECSPPLFDEELDESSVAAVSAAALKKAIEQAQESIRLAKMIMERKKEGFQDGSKHRSKSRMKVKEKRESRIEHEADGSKEIDEGGTYESSDLKFPILSGVDEKFAPSLRHKGKLVNAGNSEVERVRENVEAAVEHVDVFTEIGKKPDPTCSQTEKIHIAEKVDWENVEAAKIRTSEGVDQEKESIYQSQGPEEVSEVAGRTPIHITEKVEWENVEAAEIRTSGGVDQEQESIYQSQGPEVVAEVAGRAPNTSQRTQELDKSVDEAMEQCQVLEKVPKIPQEQAKILCEADENLRISQKDKELEERNNVADDMGKCNEKFVEHEDMVYGEHSAVLKSEFDNLLNKLQAQAERAVLEQEDMERKSENVPDWKKIDDRLGKGRDEEEIGTRQEEAHLWFESEQQLMEPLEDEISDREPEIFTEVEEVGVNHEPEIDDEKLNYGHDADGQKIFTEVEEVGINHEPEIVDEKLNYGHDADGQKIPGEFERNENAERRMDTSEFEVAETVQMEANACAEETSYDAEETNDSAEEVSYNAEETKDALREEGISEENQDKFDFQEAASEKDIDYAVDAHANNTSTVFSESQEPCDDLPSKAEEYQEVVNGYKENDSLAGETETCSAVEDKEAVKQFHLEVDEMPEMDRLHRSASEENFIRSKLDNAFEGLSSDSNTGDIDADYEELPKDKDTFETASEVHAAAGEYDAKMNMQTSPEADPSHHEAAEFDQSNLRPVFERTSESNEGSVSTSILENMDGASALEPEGCAQDNAKDKTSNRDEVKDGDNVTSDEREYVDKQSEQVYSEERSEEVYPQLNEERKETDNMETEREVEKGQNTKKCEEDLGGISTMEQKDAKGNEQKFETNDQQQRIEAIKKGREREKDRIAVERAIREARERAFAEARERAERAAVERAAAEARQRVMAGARVKLEKASIETKQPADKASIEAKLRAERAAVERATAEARERAFEKAKSQKTFTEAKTQSERNSGLKHSFSSSDLDKFNSTISESAQRRKARLERHQRIMERAAKALAEKNMRDLLAQKEQAERNRLAESLDADIKRWATGKEGNLRALLSTLQYILGPESGWQPVSLTEIITTAAVKKAYRKATLCVHPDKLQQRGASIQQKYICEKVFDLLKAAWNRFNSEER